MNKLFPISGLVLSAYLSACEPSPSTSGTNLDLDMSVLDLAIPYSDALLDQSTVNPLETHMDSGFDMAEMEPMESNQSEWERPLIFGSDLTDQALGLDLLPNHRLVVAGRTEGQLGGTSASMFADGFVALITETGELDWLIQLGSSAVDQFLDVIYHPQDIIIAGGFATGDLPEQTNSLFVDGLLVALDSSGAVLWQKLIGLGTINRLATTENGFIAVGSYEQTNGDYAAFIAKYNLDGEQEWLQSLNSPSYDSASSVTVSENQIFVCGFTSGSIINSNVKEDMDIFVAAYSLEGEKLWLKEFGSSGDDSPVRIQHDEASLIIAGYTSGLLGDQQYGGNDVAILKLDLEGGLIWQQQFGTEGSEAAYGLSITPDQDIFISGRIDESTWDEQANLNGDAFILKVDQTGELRTIKQFHQDGRDEIVDLVYEQDYLNLAGYIGSSDQSNTEQSDIFIHRINARDGLEP